MSWDVFISYPDPLRRRADEAESRLKEAGLSPYVAHRKMTPGDSWPRELAEALSQSNHLLVLWSKEAEASDWVIKEIDTFIAKGGRGQLLVVDHDGTKLLPTLGGVHQPGDLESAIRYLANVTIGVLSNEVSSLKDDVKAQREVINSELKTFLYKRFWQGFFDKPAQVHIFTCGRDVPAKPRDQQDLNDPNNNRGHGGRTNIDFWDYQTVCDIHSFFARHNPQTHLAIARPASKATEIENDLSQVLSDTLRGKDCIIIGSPDVSDYDELVLAKLHGLQPWEQKKKKKQRGFVIRKPRGTVKTQSAIYRDAMNDDEVGVALLENGEIKTPFPVHEDPEGGSGVTYGILTIALNPWQEQHEASVMILSGFTGIATNAMVQFLTDEKYSQDLHHLDQELYKTAQDRNRAVEILMEVRYSLGDRAKDRDDRRIDGVRVVSHDYIEPDE